jgi:alpha-1,3-glucosyltransferase
MLSSIVVGTFLIIWLPVLKHNPLAVMKRLFPFERGLYEVSSIQRLLVISIVRHYFKDKVANFWCTLNVFIKLRSKFTHETLAKLRYSSILTCT